MRLFAPHNREEDIVVQSAYQTELNSRRERNRADVVRRTVFLRALKLLGIVAQPALFYAVWVRYYAAKMADAYLWRGNLAVAALYGVVLMLLTRVYRGYEVGNLGRQELFASHVLAQFLTNTLFYGLSFFLCERLVSPLPLLVLYLADMLLMLILVFAEEQVYTRLSPRERLTILYRSADDLARLDLLDRFLARYEPAAQLCVTEYRPSLIDELPDADAVLIVGVDASVRNGIVKDCMEEGIPAFVLPKVGDILMRSARMDVFSGELLLDVGRPVLNPEYLLAKRCFDVVLSLLGIVLTSPVMLFTALAIKLQDGGSVLYRQTRLTKDHREFTVLKFRSMREDAEGDGVARLAEENDDRITPVGRFIRSCRIDELPQLFNILSGNMSIVGPRPERPELIEKYEAELPAFSLRLQVKAGLTGYAQIYGRYNTEPYEKLQMDLLYIGRMSLLEDLRLMFATVRVLFSRESTQGVDKDAPAEDGFVLK